MKEGHWKPLNNAVAGAFFCITELCEGGVNG